MEAGRWLMGHFRPEGDKVQLGTEERRGGQRRGWVFCQEELTTSVVGEDRH